MWVGIHKIQKFLQPASIIAMAILLGIVGSAIVFGLREYVSTLVPWWQYVLGGVYVLTILYLPTGLMGIPGRIRQWRSSQKKRETTKMASAPS